MGFFEALLDNVWADKRQEDQQAFNADQYARRYQIQTADMKAAGLNPMLAASQGAGSGASSGISSTSGTFSQGAAVASQAKLNNAQVANINADTANKAAQGRLIEAQTQAALGSAQASVSSSTLADNQAVEIASRLPYVENKAKATVEGLELTNQNLISQKMEIDQRVRVLSQTLEKLRLENKITQADIDAINRTGGVGRIARELKPASDIGSDWVPSPSKFIKSLRSK